MTRELFLYTREDCELCHEMYSELEAFIGSKEIQVHLVDIEGDAELTHRYGARIPVLAAGNRDICEIHLNIAALQSFLGSD